MSVRHIDIVAFEQVQLLDVAGPLQVFASANKAAVRAGREALYAPRVIAAHGPTVTSSAGLTMLAAPLPDEATPIDTLIVAGGGGVDQACRDETLMRWLAQRGAAAAASMSAATPAACTKSATKSATKSTKKDDATAPCHSVGCRRLASVCSGAFLLAAVGSLDDRRAVTHWDRCRELADRYPRIDVDPDPIYVVSGHVWTSAGVTAGIDLALAMVEQDIGREIAMEVARDLVVFLKRPGGQSQFSTTLQLQTVGERFSELHHWMHAHLDGDLSVPMLAHRAGMSERSFVRHYRDAAGMTPARAVEQLRVEAARAWLTDAALPMKRVAARCGFGSEETMRRSFVRVLSITPQAYRDRFAAPPL